VQADALKSAHANLSERVIAFEQPELGFHGDAATVERAEPVGMAGDATCARPS
jgi:hypothetical protein